MPVCSPIFRRQGRRHRGSGRLASRAAGQIVGCEVCDDAEALIDLGVDAAMIAAPTHLHHDIALTCIKRGVHVLVEKPIASTVEEGRAIVAAARAPA